MFYGADLHPTDPDFMVAGFRDFQLAVRAGSAWQTLIIPNSPRGWGEAEAAVSSNRPDTDWMGSWIWGAISRTTDGGKSSILADEGIDKTASAFVAPVRKCPSNENVFVTGTNRMWRTDNFFNSPRRRGLQTDRRASRIAKVRPPPSGHCLVAFRHRMQHLRLRNSWRPG
jgi:hypothetical protein